MREPAPGVSVHPSVCPLDCADTCSLSVEVSDGRVQQVRGSKVNPFTRGKICAKVATGLPQQVHGPGRLRHPLERCGPRGAGAYRKITWEQALDRIHENFQATISGYGPQAIAPLSYGGPMGLLAGSSMDKRFFHRLGATRVDASTLCAGVAGAAYESLFGEVGGIPFTELAQSRLIVVWGNNITACNLHLTRLLRDARKGGARLVVIDPKRIRIADDADLHLPLLPGTDVVLAYALAAELERLGGLDEEFIAQHVLGADRFLAEARKYPVSRAAQICGLEEEAIRCLARWWMELSPAAISMGVAPERNRNGGGGIRAAFALPVLTGNIGPRGAGVCDVSGFFPVAWDSLARPDLLPGDTREISILEVPRYILDPGDQIPIRSVFIYNHNPVAVHPRQNDMRRALSQEELFVVGSDISMTDSMALADIILPASTHLEYGDLYKAYGHHYLQRSEAVIPPVGESLPNTELFRRLARRFDFGEDCFRDSDQTLLQQALVPDSAGMNGRSADQLGVNEALDMATNSRASLLRGAAPGTPSGKIELFDAALEASCGEGLPRYRELQGRRFVVVSPSSEHRTNSTFGGVRGHSADLAVEMNPSDARDLGLRAGDMVLLHNDQGELRLPLVVSDRVRIATLYVPKGAWLRESASDCTVNALIPGHVADIAGGACYNDCTVDVAACQ